MAADPLTFDWWVSEASPVTDDKLIFSIMVYIYIYIYMPFDCGYMSLGVASDPPQVASGGVGGSDYLVKAWTPCNRGHLVCVTIG